MKILSLSGMLFLFQLTFAQWTQIGDRNTANYGTSYTPDLEYDYINSRLVLLTSEGTNQAGIHTYDGSTWTTLTSMNSTGSYRMKIDPTTGFPWLIMSGNSSTEVHFYNGSAWVQVGSGFGSGFPFGQMDLEFNPITNQPYALIYSYSNQKSISVWTFTTSWNQVGSTLDSYIDCTNLDLTFDPSSGDPVVSYNKKASSDVTGHVKVNRFTNGIWNTLGDLSSGTGKLITYNQVAYDGSDVLHLYYWSQDIGTQVKKYNGSSFVDASTGTGSLSGSYFHMRLDPYSDLLWFAPLENSKMMQLDGNNYTEVSSDLIFTGASFTAPRLAFDSINHIAYIAAVENGANSVKIKMYDQDPFTSINSIEQSNIVWKVFPNPTAGEINIEIQEGKQQVDLYLINDLGQTVQSWTFDNVEKIHVSINAEKGKYLLKAVTENIQSSKILILE